MYNVGGVYMGGSTSYKVDIEGMTFPQIFQLSKFILEKCSVSHYEPQGILTINNIFDIKQINADKRFNKNVRFAGTTNDYYKLRKLILNQIDKINSIGISIGNSKIEDWQATFHVKKANQIDSTIGLMFNVALTQKETMSYFKTILTKLIDNHIISNKNDASKIVECFFLKSSRDIHDWKTEDFSMRANAIINHPIGFWLFLSPKSTDKIFSSLENLASLKTQPINYKVVNLTTELQTLLNIGDSIQFSDCTIELNLEHISDIDLLKLYADISSASHYKLKLMWGDLDWFNKGSTDYNSMDIIIDNDDIKLIVDINYHITDNVSSLIETRIGRKLTQFESSGKD